MGKALLEWFWAIYAYAYSTRECYPTTTHNLCALFLYGIFIGETFCSLGFLLFQEHVTNWYIPKHHGKFNISMSNNHFYYEDLMSKKNYLKKLSAFLTNISFFEKKKLKISSFLTIIYLVSKLARYHIRIIMRSSQ